MVLISAVAKFEPYPTKSIKRDVLADANIHRVEKETLLRESSPAGDV